MIGGKKLRGMLIPALLAVWMAASLSGCQTGDDPGSQRTDLSAVELYTQFMDTLRSGTVRKVSVDWSNVYNVFNSTTEVIKFGEVNGVRKLTYQKYNPVIFWNIPQPHYYDGQYYYYQYKDDWFVDNYNRFNDHLQPDLLGVPAHILNKNNIVSEAVYDRAFGLETRIVSVDEENGLTQKITGKLDHKLEFTSINVIIEKNDDRSGDDGGLFRPAASSLYRIRYYDLNEDGEVRRPADLRLSDIEFLRQYYMGGVDE